MKIFGVILRQSMQTMVAELGSPLRQHGEGVQIWQVSVHFQDTTVLNLGFFNVS
jgi:hypothetical protein